MASSPAIAPPESLGAALAPLGSLSEEEFERLENAVSKPRSFSLKSTQIKELQAQLPSLANLAFLLGALSFLYSQLEELGDLGSKYSGAIAKLVDDVGIKETSPGIRAKVQSRLERLLRKNAANARYRKLQRLESGFLPNATSFGTLVDLRPDFGDGDGVEYRGLIKVIQIRIKTDAVDPSQRELVFQVNEEALAELQKAIKRLQEKIDAINQSSGLSSQLMKSDS